VSARGQLRFDTAGASPDIAYTGDLSLDGFNALDRINDTDFMRWTRISAQGLAVQTRPLALKVQTVRLDDFYTRLILDAQGRLNLRELTAEDRETLDKAEAKAVPDAPASIRASAEAVGVREGFMVDTPVVSVMDVTAGTAPGPPDR
jgi:hypothetical protein